MDIRQQAEALEKSTLSEYATLSSGSMGRLVAESECEIRTCFQRDADRIVHSKSFRRLMHKTQVFLRPEGDHYRTRMIHTIEVSRIARTVSRALRLNEGLTEAIALGHDIGHTPFGHAGERALNDIYAGGFRHNENSLRVVDIIEKGGRGLNLTLETRDGILCHTGDKQADTREGRIVRYADRIAYINHDIDDAIRGGIISDCDIPSDISAVLGDTHKFRINSLVTALISGSTEGRIEMPLTYETAMDSLRTFMFENVYTNPRAKNEEHKAHNILSALFEHYVAHPEALPEDMVPIIENEGLERCVCDYIAGMTDKFAVYKFNDVFVPSSWSPR